MNENNVANNNSNTFDNNITSSELESSNVNANNEMRGIGNEVTGSNLNDYQQPKSKNKNVGVLVAILIILVIALVGLLATHHFANSQNAFKVLIDKGFNYLEEIYTESTSATGTFLLKVNGNSSDTSSNDVFKILNKVDISGTYGIDYNNKIMSLDIKSNYDNKKLINANIYTEAGNGYIYLEELYDKYIKMEIEDYDSIFESISKEDYKKIIKGVNNALNDALKDEYFTKTTATVNNKKVDKTTLVLNKTNSEKINKDFINSLLEDEEFLNSVSKVSKEEVTDIKETLKESLETENDEEFTATDISIYTDNTKFVKFELSNDTTSITIIKNDETYDYEIKSEPEETIKGSITIKLEENNVTCTVSASDETNENSFEISVTSSITYDTAVDKKDISNNINYEDITENEMTGIYTKIMNQEGLMNFITDISNLSNSNDDYDVTA